MLRQLPTLRCALADIDSVKLAEAGIGLSVPLLPDYREMLLDDAIDVVHICTPYLSIKHDSGGPRRRKACFLRNR